MLFKERRIGGANDPRGRDVVRFRQRLNTGMGVLGQNHRGSDGLPDGGGRHGRGHPEVSDAPMLCQTGESCTTFIWRNIRRGAFLPFPTGDTAEPAGHREAIMLTEAQRTSRISADLEKASPTWRMLDLDIAHWFSGRTLGKINAGRISSGRFPPTGSAIVRAGKTFAGGPEQKAVLQTSGGSRQCSRTALDRAGAADSPSMTASSSTRIALLRRYRHSRPPEESVRPCRR